MRTRFDGQQYVLAAAVLFGVVVVLVVVVVSGIGMGFVVVSGDGGQLGLIVVQVLLVAEDGPPPKEHKTDVFSGPGHRVK